MADALEQAAAAFQNDMGGGSSRQEESATSAPTETLFDNLGEYTENSEEFAGGDAEEVVKPKPKKAERNEEAIDDEGNYIDDDDDGEGEAGADDETGEGDEEDDGGDEEESVFEVVVDGEPVKVGLTEALDGYVRTETFHRRLNELAEAKKVIVAEAANVHTRRSEYIAKLEEAEALLTGIIPQQPDWDKLYAEDPAAARKLQKDYEALQSRVNEIRKSREQAQAEASQEEAKNTESYIKSEFQTFLDHNPRIRKQADLVKELNSMKRTALSVGFSEDEVNVVYDSRMLRILQKASKYDRMMAAKPKPVQQGKRPNGSSAVANKAALKNTGKAQSKLRQTGSIEDAAAVFQTLLK